MAFEERVAVITGASQGIGRAVAREFAKRGARSVIAARSEEAIQEAAKELRDIGPECLASVTDVRDPQAVGEMVDRAIDEFGRIDVLVTCAASEAASGRTEELSYDDWKGTLDTDLTGTFLTCQAVGRTMIAQRYGRIVNLTSFHVVATYPERAAYVAAKAGVWGLTKALAVEWGKYGITANAVAPGPIRTPRTEWFLSRDDQAEGGMLDRTPRLRLGEPQDVAAAVVFLGSEEAGHISGESLVIDGGWTKNAWWGSHRLRD